MSLISPAILLDSALFDVIYRVVTDLKIDNDSFSFTCLQALDRERTSTYVLEVYARDNGKPPLSAKTLVSIEVTDSNDNPPVFSALNYTAVVQVC